MTIFLNRKGLESPLVEMPRSFGVVVSVPTHCVGMRQPPKEIGYLILVLRFDNKMPMIGHHDVRKDRQCHFVPGFFQHTFESYVVRFLFEKSQTRNGTIDNVKAGTTRENPWSTRQGKMVT